MGTRGAFWQKCEIARCGLRRTVPHRSALESRPLEAEEELTNQVIGGVLPPEERPPTAQIAFHDQLWSHIVMKQVGIAELKSRLSEFLRIVQGGESIAVLDRNRAVAQIVPVRERTTLRIRAPVPDSPKPNKVPLPKPIGQKIDVVQLLLEERQSHR